MDRRRPALHALGRDGGHLLSYPLGHRHRFYGGLFNYILEHDLWQHEYVLNYTNASYLLDEEYSFDVETGIFSGFDKDSATYDAKTWHYQ